MTDQSPEREGRPSLLAAGCALLTLAAAVALLLVPMRGFGTSPLSALLAHSQPLPRDTAPRQDPAEVAADQAAVDSAQKALDDIRAEGTRVTEAQKVASDTSDQATKARNSADSSDNYTLQTDVDMAQSDVDMANSSIDYDNSRISSAKSSLDATRNYGGDTTYEQQELDDANAALATDKQKLTDAQNALAAAKSKLDAATSGQQDAAHRADALSSSAADLQRHADDLADQQRSRESAANDALSSAQETQSRHRSDAATALARWSHDHRVAVDEVRARNSVISNARSAAVWVAGSAGGLLLVAMGLTIAALVAWRRNRPSPAGASDESDTDSSGVGALMGMLRDRLPSPRRRLRRS